MHLYFQLKMTMLLIFTDAERVPFRETTRGPYDAEVTDEEDYVSDDHPIVIVVRRSQ